MSTLPDNKVTSELVDIDLNHHQYYVNRELSHLQFNQRVLKQTLDISHPLLNRLLFCCIFSSNMDEFFEIRVAGIQNQIKYGRETIGPDGLSPQQTLDAINRTAHELVREQYEILNDILIPALAEENIRFLRRNEWSEAQQAWIADYFDREVLPIINPIGLDPSHPFPRLVNKSLNFIAELDGKDAFGRETGLAIIPAPRSLPRMVKLPSDIADGDEVVFLSSIIHAHADQLFPGMIVQGCYQFRLTRNADFELANDEMEDLASALKGELLSRRFGDAVRLELADNCPEHLISFLLKEFKLTEHDLYQVHGPVNLSRLMELANLVDRPDLLYPSFAPGTPKTIRGNSSLFPVIRQKDILLHHPFQSYTPVIDFLRQAAKDPDVVIVKPGANPGEKKRVRDFLESKGETGPPDEPQAVLERLHPLSDHGHVPQIGREIRHVARGRPRPDRCARHRRQPTGPSSMPAHRQACRSPC